jgi:hypothetical protein
MIHPDQLKLLMTPQEIKSGYQPLDADRAYNQGPIPRGGEGTDRPRRTDMGYNDQAPEGGRGLMMKPYIRRMKDFRAEPVADTWQRKAQEANESGLTESIHQHGVVYPVTLGDVPGLEGKPQITGGHHRIAGAEQAGGEQYLQVIHHRGLVEGAVTSLQQMGKHYR